MCINLHQVLIFVDGVLEKKLGNVGQYQDFLHDSALCMYRCSCESVSVCMCVFVPVCVHVRVMFHVLGEEDKKGELIWGRECFTFDQFLDQSLFSLPFFKE